MKTKSIGFDEGGCYAEVYSDTDDGSGKIGRWYGSLNAVKAIDPEKVKLYPMTLDNSPDPFDLACERRFD